MIGLLHPGSMGATVGAALHSNGHAVGWVSKGRSTDTRRRAEAAGLVDLHSLSRLLDECSIIVAVCPPEGALELAERVRGFAGLYVDANAISPATAARVDALITGGGGAYVDGCLIGLAPPTRGLVPNDTIRLYLSGPSSPQVAGLFSAGSIEARCIGTDPTTASALKMAFAAWSKGSSALLLAVRAMAAYYGVTDLLLAEWATTSPALAGRSNEVAQAALGKAWRWSYEMSEVADTLQGAGLPTELARGASRVFAALPQPEKDMKNRHDAEEAVARIVAALLGSSRTAALNAQR